MAHRIFISYRRKDSRSSALLLAKALEARVGAANVFIDVDIRAGARFPEALDAALDGCTALLAIIGPDWLDMRGESGQRRLDDPNDFVRREIARALERAVPVILVRVDGAQLPERDSLPDNMKGMIDHQAVRFTDHEGFRYEFDGLVRDLDRLLVPQASLEVGARRRTQILVAAGLALVAGTVVLLTIGPAWLPKSDPAVPHEPPAPPKAAKTERAPQVEEPTRKSLDGRPSQPDVTGADRASKERQQEREKEKVAAHVAIAPGLRVAHLVVADQRLADTIRSQGSALGPSLRLLTRDENTATATHQLNVRASRQERLHDPQCASGWRFAWHLSFTLTPGPSLGGARTEGSVTGGECYDSRRQDELERDALEAAVGLLVQKLRQVGGDK